MPPTRAWSRGSEGTGIAAHAHHSCRALLISEGPCEVSEIVCETFVTSRRRRVYRPNRTIRRAKSAGLRASLISGSGVVSGLQRFDPQRREPRSTYSERIPRAPLDLPP